MSKNSARSLAKKLLEGEPGALQQLRVHEFTDDESAHDDQLIERILAEFSGELDIVQKELTEVYGAPARTGDFDDETVPFSGAFRFAVWEVGKKQLFVAAAHEDRGVPIILMLGTA